MKPLATARALFPGKLTLEAILCVAALLATSLAAQSQPPAATAPGSTAKTAQAQPAPAPEYVPGQLLVRFKPGVAKLRINSTHAAVGSEVLRQYRLVENLQLIKISPGKTVEWAMEAYRRNPDVLYAEPDYIVRAEASIVTPHELTTDANGAIGALAVPNDPKFTDGSLWALHNTGGIAPPWTGTPDADIDAPEAWELSTGSSSVVVAVIGTGINYNHEDLAGNMLQLESNCADAIDNDGNGYVDDCFGIDVVNNDSDPMDEDSAFRSGTMVAGIIGAVGNNGVGVVGVNWTTKMIACKSVLNNLVGSTSAQAACLDYVGLLKDRGVNIIATCNCIVGAELVYSQSMLDEMIAHWQRGMLYVACGHYAADVDYSFASGANVLLQALMLPNVIAAAATDKFDELSGGRGRHTMHLGAPGGLVLSTNPKGGYSTYSGPQFAAGYVAGVAALLKAQDPGRDYLTIKNLILAGGDDKPSTAQTTISGKRLNAHGAMTCANSTVLARLRPTTSLVDAAVGTPVLLAALHINCAQPNGNVSVVVNPGGEVITLLDDGASPDQQAGDGIYTGEWTPAVDQLTTLTFPGGDVVQAFLSAYTSALTRFQYRNITGTNLSCVDDSCPRPFTPPFPLAFGGGSFSSVWPTANGVLRVEGEPPTFWVNFPLPDNNFDKLVAPFFDDLYNSGSPLRNVFWEVVGAPPSRELVVEWRGLQHYECHSDGVPWSVKFQVVFFEGSPNILFNYADTVFGGTWENCIPLDHGGSATVGVQTRRNLASQFSYNSPTLSDNMALVWTTPGSSPPPAINPGGAVNAASFAPGAPLAPGSITAVFGTHLAAATAFAGAVPLPTMLGGANMICDGTQAVPKFFASPLQINIQIPWELAGQGQASLDNAVAGLASNTETVTLASFAPGVFATNQAGTGQGAILIANTPFLAAPSGAFPGSRPAVRGTDFLEIYWTGGGQVTPPVATGAAASASPLSVTTSTPTVIIGGVPATVLFSGLAPGYVSLYVATLQVPANAPTENAVPVVLTIGGAMANTVTIAVE